MLSLFLPAAFVATAWAVNNGLARTPQMGWNNWNSLGCDVSESLLLDTARSLSSYGLKDVGYNYVVLDDCWQATPIGRAEDGYWLVDQDKFPNGMKYISDELHKDGLLYGMYSSAGEMTCARYEGSLDHEKEDAESLASWGVDYLKYDNCYHRGRFGYPEVSFNRYDVMAKALKATGRPILYSLCTWGEDYVHTWAMSIANSWRISGDIYDSFTRPDDLCSCTEASDPHCVAPGTHCSVLNIINKVAPYADRGQHGGWNDLDMLEVGQGGMTFEEYKAHFGMWAALKSPLLIGADLRSLDAEALTVLNNPAVIAVSQDPLGKSVARIARDRMVKKDKYGEGETHIWSGSLYPNDQLLIFLNAADEDLEMSTTLDEVFIKEGAGGMAPQSKVQWDMFDLWGNMMEKETAKGALQGNVPKSWYNSTEIPYKDGLQLGDERLLGKKVGIAGPGQIKVHVPRHAMKMYRLRSQGAPAGGYSITKDEL